MRKLFVVLLVLASVLASAQAKPGDAPSKQLMAANLAAWSTGGPEAAAPFYDKSPENVYFDIAPVQYKGWTEYQAGVKEVLAGFETFKLTLRADDEPRIHTAGNWAWGTATFTADGKLKNGNAVDLTGRWTVIWQKKAGKWLIVHEHVSAPWGGPEPEKREK